MILFEFELDLYFDTNNKGIFKYISPVPVPPKYGTLAVIIYGLNLFCNKKQRLL